MLKDVVILNLYLTGLIRLIFPEAFLWHVFRSVATAICYWARGTTDDEPIPGWQEIIHRDLKPANSQCTYTWLSMKPQSIDSPICSTSRRTNPTKFLPYPQSR